MKDMEVDDEMVKDAKDFDRKIQTVRKTVASGASKIPTKSAPL